MKYPATLPMPTILPAQAVPDSCWDGGKASTRIALHDACTTKLFVSWFL